MDNELIEISQDEFENNFDKYMNLIENEQKQYLIRREDGSAVVAAPITEELEPLLDIMPEMNYDDLVPGEPSF
jgi:hypothetical protein